MKNVLILGGSYLQSHFIRNAMNTCNVFVIDGNSECFASKNKLGVFHNIDFSDKLKVKTFCIENKIDAVIAPVNELGNIIASEIANELGYVYNSTETVIQTTDKSLYHYALKKNKFDRVKSFNVEQKSEIIYPVIVKPTQSTSSKGVTLVYDKENLDKAIEYALNNSRVKNYKIEEYIVGRQFSIETISQNKNHYIVGVVEENLSNPPYFFERCDVFDKDLQLEYKLMFESFVKNILDVFNIEVGPCHIEVIVKESKIYLIDIASRSGGWRDIMLYYAGINYNQLILESYLGVIEEKIIPIPKFTVGAGILLYENDNIQFEKAKKTKYFVESFLYDYIPKSNPKTLADAFGYYFLKCHEKSQIIKLLPTII